MLNHPKRVNNPIYVYLLSPGPKQKLSRVEFSTWGVLSVLRKWPRRWRITSRSSLSRRRWGCRTCRISVKGRSRAQRCPRSSCSSRQWISQAFLCSCVAFLVGRQTSMSRFRLETRNAEFKGKQKGNLGYLQFSPACLRGLCVGISEINHFCLVNQQPYCGLPQWVKN